jgi:hypothetical protein
MPVLPVRKNRNVSAELKHLCINLHETHGYLRRKIQQLTAVSRFAQARFSRLYHNTGDVAAHLVWRGRKRMLVVIDCAVCVILTW